MATERIELPIVGVSCNGRFKRDCGPEQSAAGETAHLIQGMAKDKTMGGI